MDREYSHGESQTIVVSRGQQCEFIPEVHCYMDLLNLVQVMLPRDIWTRKANRKGMWETRVLCEINVCLCIQHVLAFAETCIFMKSLEDTDCDLYCICDPLPIAWAYGEWDCP